MNRLQQNVNWIDKINKISSNDNIHPELRNVITANENLYKPVELMSKLVKLFHKFRLASQTQLKILDDRIVECNQIIGEIKNPKFIKDYNKNIVKFKSKLTILSHIFFSFNLNNISLDKCTKEEIYSLRNRLDTEVLNIGKIIK